MRIARILTRLNLGGPARQALASDPELVRRGHTVRLFAGTPEPGEGDLAAAFTARGLDLVRIPGLVRSVAPLRDLRVRRRLGAELASFEPDLVHTHASKAGTLGRAAVGGLAGAERIGRVHTFHGHVLEGYFPAVVSRRLVAHERRLAADTDRIVAVSHATADDLVRLGVVGEEKLCVVQPGVELKGLLELERGTERPRAAAEVRALLGAEPGDFVVGVVGRLAEVKRPEQAVDVFELLADRHPRLHLVFVGDGDQRRALERRIADSGSRAVHMLGAMENMETVLAALDAVLLTSRSEGMPVALIEAAAAGLPVVGTDVGGVSELVVHERTGLLGTTVEELAFGLARLLEDPREARAMGERARLRIARSHSAERLAERLEELYFAVLEERAAGVER